MKAMVLAAGVGTRLDPLTSCTPKPLVPVVNMPVMAHILKLLSKHGINDICANLHYLPDQIINYFGDGTKLGLKLSFQYEEELTGDAGGVRSCRSFLAGDTFVVIMGDLITDIDLTEVIRLHKQKRSLATIAVKPLDDVSRFGVVVHDKGGFITGFQEKPSREEALSNLVSTGIYILEPAVFQYMPDTGPYGFGRQLFPDLVAKGLPVLAVTTTRYWSDVGSLEQYHMANMDALAGLVEVEIPANRYADAARVLVGKNSRIAAGAQLTGGVVIGDDCIIESAATLHDTVVWSGVHIGRGASLTGCIVGNNCIIEPGSHHHNKTIVVGQEERNVNSHHFEQLSRSPSTASNERD